MIFKDASRSYAELEERTKPSGVAFVDELPRNAGGKVLKRRLREAYAERARA